MSTLYFMLLFMGAPRVFSCTHHSSVMLHPIHVHNGGDRAVGNVTISSTTRLPLFVPHPPLPTAAAASSVETQTAVPNCCGRTLLPRRDGPVLVEKSRSFSADTKHYRKGHPSRVRYNWERKLLKATCCSPSRWKLVIQLTRRNCVSTHWVLPFNTSKQDDLHNPVNPRAIVARHDCAPKQPVHGRFGR